MRGNSIRWPQPHGHIRPMLQSSPPSRSKISPRLGSFTGSASPCKTVNVRAGNTQSRMRSNHTGSLISASFLRPERASLVVAFGRHKQDPGILVL